MDEPGKRGLIAEAARRLAAASSDAEIVLFGSHAGGEADEHSDLGAGSRGAEGGPRLTRRRLSLYPRHRGADRLCGRAGLELPADVHAAERLNPYAGATRYGLGDPASVAPSDAIRWVELTIGWAESLVPTG
jgi:hypothetical protein